LEQEEVEKSLSSQEEEDTRNLMTADEFTQSFSKPDGSLLIKIHADDIKLLLEIVMAV
jgi:hypothetical protein